MGIIQFSVFLRNTRQELNPQIIIMTIILGTVAAGTTVTVGTGALAAGALLGGVAILKGLLIGSLLARGGGHKKRSAEQDNEDGVFLVFNNEVAVTSPKFDYFSAAKVGKLVKNAGACEVRYSCPLSTAEISKIFA